MKKVIILLLCVAFAVPLLYAIGPEEILDKPWEQMTREQRRAFARMRTMSAFEHSGKPSRDRLTHYIAIFKDLNVTDPKSSYCDISAEDNGTTIVLKGEVLVREYRGGIENSLRNIGFEEIENQITILPDPGLFPEAFGAALKTPVSMKRGPREKSEQLNQLLEGAPVRLLKSDESGEWFLVQGPDGYVGWAAAAEIRRMPIAEWARLRNKPGKDDAKRRARILEISKPIMGIPYIWGGITEEGMDCSGYTQHVYRAMGVILPRDADQQSAVGELVGFPGYMSNLRPGDLIFFCGGNGRVSHVAISLGGPDFIESTNEKGVHFSSFDPDSPDYNEKTAERTLFARRIFSNGIPAK